jgi:hypothetical protein
VEFTLTHDSPTFRVKALEIVYGEGWQDWSIVNTPADENGCGKPQCAYGWVIFEITLADGVNSYAVTFAKGIGDDLKALSVHFYVFGGGEAEVLDPGTLLGAGLRRTLGDSGFFRYGL